MDRAAPIAPPAETQWPAVDLAAPIAPPAETHAVVRATKRDYDYFTDLDEKLARLWAEDQAEDSSSAEQPGVE